MEIENSKLQKMLRQAYEELQDPSKRKNTPPLKWPTDIAVTEEMGKITLHITQNAIRCNMQDNVSAFEGWLLILKTLVYKDCKFAVDIDKIDKNDKHYQRFLFRLSLFDSLYGEGSHGSWFELSQAVRGLLDSDCLYRTHREKNKLISNKGTGNRGKGKDNPSKILSGLSESELEWRLCKGGADKDCLKNTFNTEDIFRQFPVGIFQDKVMDKNALFPGKKACVDLVADGVEEKSFWIFELKKKGNIPLGIISELLFYTAIVRDMIANRIITMKPLDADCYDSTRLVNNKEIINACFLAPDLHPLLLNHIVDQLNNAFVQLKERDKMCSVVFHKAILDMDDTGKLFIRSQC